jgi:hypothetical protein
VLHSSSIKEPVNSKRNDEEFCKSHPSSHTKEFKSFIKDFVAYEDNKDYRKDNISINKDGGINPIESKHSVESKNQQQQEKIEDDKQCTFCIME